MTRNEVRRDLKTQLAEWRLVGTPDDEARVMILMVYQTRVERGELTAGQLVKVTEMLDEILAIPPE